jgi:hypothetical protein
MSTIVTAGLIERITPFMAATYGLPAPKSVVKVMMLIDKRIIQITPVVKKNYLDPGPLFVTCF